MSEAGVSGADLQSSYDTQAKACDFDVLAPQLHWFRGSPIPDDGAPRLDQSLQLETGTPVLLEWEAEPGVSVELIAPGQVRRSSTLR